MREELNGREAVDSSTILTHARHRTLNARLTTVCNLRDNLNAPSNDRKELKEARKALVGTAIDHQVLLAEFERVCQVHLQHRQQVISMMSLQDEKKKQSGGETSG